MKPDNEPKNRTNWKKLCAELLKDVEGLEGDRCSDYSELTLRARKALKIGPPKSKWDAPVEGDFS